MEHEEQKYEVNVMPGANDRMADHFEFLARVSESAAYRLLDTLMEDIRSLEKRPYRNPVYERPFTPAGKYRYLMSYERYRIVYMIEENQVYVDDIQDCRQDNDKSLVQE